MTKNKQNLQPLHHDDEILLDSESLEAYLRQMYGTSTGFDELQELFKDVGPDSEAFQESLEDLTLDALMQNNEFMRNAALIRKGKLTPEREDFIRGRQKALHDSYRQSIVITAGLPAESGSDSLEQARASVGALLSDMLQNKPDASIDDVLSALGMVTIDEEGKERFQYPEHLFPEQTNEKWRTYIATVLNHIKVAKALSKEEASQSDVTEADRTRKVAHDAITNDIDVILGLGQLDESEWDFAKSRELVAKMRDKRFPTIETSESRVTARAIADGTIGMHALKSLLKQK